MKKRVLSVVGIMMVAGTTIAANPKPHYACNFYNYPEKLSQHFFYNGLTPVVRVILGNASGQIYVNDDGTVALRVGEEGITTFPAYASAAGYNFPRRVDAVLAVGQEKLAAMLTCTQAW